MPGLNSTNLDWEHSLVKRNMESMLAKYRKIYELDKAGLSTKEFNAFYTPYQFTIPILQELYFLFEKGDKDPTVKDIEENVLKASNPKDRIAASNTPLRAIAYLTWEAESRVFLVRRVFPTYFDFLSVSHIPEGWGVSSIMLRELQERFRKDRSENKTLVNGRFFEEVDMAHPENYAYTLPYLAEQKRLKYEHVLVLPVFKSAPPPESDRDMLGAFLFFVGAGGGLPMGIADKSRFQKFTEPLCRATAELVTAHNEALDPNPLALADCWRRLPQENDYNPRVAEVILKCHHPHNGAGCVDLESAARKFLKALTVPNYYAIRDPSAEKKYETAVFLVTARQGDVKYPDFLKDFKRRLLRVVTESLSEEKVKCEVNINPTIRENIKPEDSQTRQDFHLNADKWGIPEPE
jgi:hypothetical protein